MVINTTNTKSRAYVAFIKSIKMRDKWIEAVNKGMSMEEMEKEGIKPIGIKK